MVAPLLVAAGIAGGAQILSGIAQFYQAEKSRKANQRELNEIKAVFDAIKPPEYDVSITDPPELISQSIPPAAFDMSNIDPVAYQIAAKYMPEVASYIAEQNPTVVELSATGQFGRDAQIQALQDIRMRTGELSDAESQSASSQAMRDAQIASQSRSESILQDANRRGMLGSGAMLAAQLQGGSDAMERSANLSNQAYLDALRAKRDALSTSGEMGRQLATDEFGRSAINANIINQFNQRAAQNINEANRYAANTLNQGQMFNVQNAQDIANRNANLLNQSQWQNRQRQDQLLGQTWNMEQAERSRLNQIAQQDYQNQMASKNAYNEILGTQFGNQMDINRSRFGMSTAQMGQNTQTAQDRNQAIQGLGQGISNTAMFAGAYYNPTQQTQQPQQPAPTGQSYVPSTYSVLQPGTQNRENYGPDFTNYSVLDKEKENKYTFFPN